MPQYTKNYRIPYPVAGDPIHLGAAQMEALAKKVDETMITVRGTPGPAGPAGPQGAQGPAGPAGPTGPQGPQGLRGATGPAGPKGDTGPQGPAGTGFTLLGTRANASELPTGAAPGDAYLLAEDSTVMVWSGNQWENVGRIQGPQGPAGPAGPTGPAGPQGPQGLRGLTGPAGATGATGTQGPTGPQGPAGPKGDTGPQGLRGPTGPAAPVYVGILRWSGGWYNPPGNTFTRLRTTSDGNLSVAKNIGGCARNDSNNPRLIAPVNGTYLLSVSQVWGNGSFVKGAGLGTSIRSGEAGMMLWADENHSSFLNTSVIRYLPAGTTLYPWTFNSTNTGMSPGDRDMKSEYSITLLAAG